MGIYSCGVITSVDGYGSQCALTNAAVLTMVRGSKSWVV